MHKESKSSTKSIVQWSLILAATIALVSGIVAFYSFSRSRFNVQSQTSNPQKNSPAIIAITALGRIEPEGEVMGEVTHLSAPYSLGGAPRVERLLVKEGQKVRAGQLVALIDGYASRLAALEQAKNQVQIAQARLAQVNAGAKLGDINAQKATIARLEAEAANAQLEFERYQSLYEQGAISASLRDTKLLVLETDRKQLKQAKDTLQSLAEVRPVDVQLAQDQLDSAITAVKQAQADLDLTYIRSPITGQILKIDTKSGEIIGSQGIAEIGETRQMCVVAEIYETDIGKVHLGQIATITSPAFSGELRGRVTQLGRQVERQSVFDVNPSADTDHKVVETKIRIVNSIDSQRIAGLTNLQVDVSIPIYNHFKGTVHP